VIDRGWLVQHLTLFRLALFACCAAYGWLGWRSLRPRGVELSAGIMAAWVQLSFGSLLDIQVARMGFWSYRPMPFTLCGVLLDLHLDWALLWGFLMVWLYSRRRRPGVRFALLYAGLWTGATIGLDVLVTRYLPFLSHRAARWWIADLGLLVGVLGPSLWVYHSILFPPRQLGRRVWNCRVRSVVYVSSLAYLLYGYLPAVVLSLTGGWRARPLLPAGDWRVLAAAAVPPLLLGGWATLAFTDAGLGTPLPLDPPLRLVTTGPYAFVRNPMQIAGLMMAAILLIYHPTMYMLFYVIDMALVSAVLFHIYERGQLEDAFGASYMEYAKQVRNWLPRFRPYGAPGDTPVPMTDAAYP
jgi:protein-S-isoprenylcysteine O-methyltransferase Ste14